MLGRTSFNRESDSFSVGAHTGQSNKQRYHCFNRESDSFSVGAFNPACSATDSSVSIAKAIPSLLEPHWYEHPSFCAQVSIAKAIPSLLEHRRRHDHRCEA